MLIDDITRGINSFGNGVTRVLAGGIKGAFLFAGIAFLGAAIMTSWPIFFSGAILGGLFAAKGAILLAGIAAAKVGALIGAPIMAVASIIPGKEKNFGLDTITRDRPPTRSSDDLQAERARAMEQMPPNPNYKPGLGAQLAQRNAPQPQQERTVS